MQAIRCPHCKKEIEISEALHAQVLAQVEKAQEEKFKEELEKIRLEEKEKTEKKIKEQLDLQLKESKEEAVEAKERNKKLQEQLLELTKTLREEKEKFDRQELENLKKQQEEREKVKEEISKIESEKSQLKLAEVQKQLDDTKKALEEAQRKSSQVSQQLQGEVLELQLEALLRETFQGDEIIEVKKGENGADIRQIVKSPKGFSCGIILWEFKRRKTWGSDWIEKLKEDMRNEGDAIPVIVTTAMPKDIKNLGVKERVWVTSQEFVIPLAELLRKNILDVAYQKALMANRTGKADLVLGFVTSQEFVNQVEAIVESHKALKDQITKERAAFERQWKEREEHLDKLYKSTARVVGSIYGRVGASMPSIKGLDLLESPSEE